MSFAHEPGRAFRGLRHGLAAVRRPLNRVERRAGKLEDLITRHVGPDGGRAHRADVDERDRDVPRGEKAAHECGFAAFRVERGQEENGRHVDAHYTQ